MQDIDGTILNNEITPDSLKRSVGEEITFHACVHKIRSASGFSFVLVRTGRYLIQTVHDTKRCEKGLDELKEGMYIELCGTVKEEPRAELGAEIILKDFTVLSRPAAEMPLHVSDSVLGCSIETSMSYRTAALRHPKERAVFRISEGVVNAFRELIQKNAFTEIHTPKITSYPAEGGKGAFPLKYFGNNAFLTQSPQLYKQICIAFFDRVFEVSHAFRAEKHNSARHLNEFISLDLEMGYIESILDIMSTQAAVIKYITAYLKENYSYELELLGASLPEITGIPSITFYEALDILKKPHEQVDLDPTDEVKISEYAKKEYGSEFMFITHFPAVKRPFYIADSTDDPALTESFDLLFRGMEIASGGQRIHTYAEQLAKLERSGIAPEELEWFLSSLKYGMPPHGGFGMGLERFVMKLLDLENIRQASLFPRDMHHLIP